MFCLYFLGLRAKGHNYGVHGQRVPRPPPARAPRLASPCRARCLVLEPTALLPCKTNIRARVLVRAHAALAEAASDTAAEADDVTVFDPSAREKETLAKAVAADLKAVSGWVRLRVFLRHLKV